MTALLLALAIVAYMQISQVEGDCFVWNRKEGNNPQEEYTLKTGDQVCWQTSPSNRGGYMTCQANGDWTEGKCEADKVCSENGWKINCVDATTTTTTTTEASHSNEASKTD